MVPILLLLNNFEYYQNDKKSKEKNELDSM